jgi:hypothetical protein
MCYVTTTAAVLQRVYWMLAWYYFQTNFYLVSNTSCGSNDYWYNSTFHVAYSLNLYAQILYMIFFQLLFLWHPYLTVLICLSVRKFYHHHHPHLLLHSSLAVSQKSTDLTDQALLIHCSAQNVLTVRYVLSISAFCIRIYRARRRLNSFKLPCNLAQIIPTNALLLLTL